MLQKESETKCHKLLLTMSLISQNKILSVAQHSLMAARYVGVEAHVQRLISMKYVLLYGYWLRRVRWDWSKLQTSPNY